MIKYNNLNNIKTIAFNNELNKIADEVQIPKGGLKSGLLMNDLTQLMSTKDSERIKSKLPFYKRSGPGIIPSTIFGAIGGSSIHGIIRELIKKGPKYGPTPGLKGAIIGGISAPVLNYITMKSGLYNKQALKAANKLVKEN